MAGEVQDNSTVAYNEIDTNKVLNKTGLLELSGQIKGYINTNMPQSYTLPTASTSTLGGVKVDGETITIADGVISVTSSGGSSYTAGDGIDIDSNGVISKTSGALPLFVLLSYIFTGTQTGQYNQTNTNNIMINSKLGKAKTDTHIANLKAYGMTITSDGTSQALMRAIVPAMGDVVANTFYYCGVSNSMDSQYTLSAGNSQANTADAYMAFGMNNNPTLILFNPNEAYGSYYRWYFIQLPWKLFQNHYFNSQKGLTSHSIAGAIDEVATRIPSAPTTDGTYMLKCVVSSGTLTYSWEEITVGGSY